MITFLCLGWRKLSQLAKVSGRLLCLEHSLPFLELVGTDCHKLDKRRGMSCDRGEWELYAGAGDWRWEQLAEPHFPARLRLHKESKTSQVEDRPFHIQEMDPSWIYKSLKTNWMDTGRSLCCILKSVCFWALLLDSHKKLTSLESCLVRPWGLFYAPVDRHKQLMGKHRTPRGWTESLRYNLWFVAGQT